jgi:hypothetical protein
MLLWFSLLVESSNAVDVLERSATPLSEQPLPFQCRSARASSYSFIRIGFSSQVHVLLHY